ncbi:MAG: sigma-54 dependent transcriptional regulator [Proteobacteria bacterium]|nr:sigma-54 dependent transcriptional regulator [Pseudomonadota bacterium]
MDATGSEAHRIKLLLVEDDEDVARTVARKLTADGMDVEVVYEPFGVIKRLDAGDDDWDVVVMDVGLPGISGIDLLKRFRESHSLASVIMLTGDNTAQTAATCMRAGAFHYVTKPFRPFELSAIVSSAARHTAMRRQLDARYVHAANLLVGTSTAITRLRAALDRLGTQSVSILVQGESGTGKELVARTLHARGERRARAFVPLNCGAIPESLIDSELFGHAKGAFTGATADRQGVFVEADGGTLFLDEIGDMPMGVQARLLRVLQEGEVRPVGGSGVRSIDVRVITATHVDLKLAVERGRFRQDLFYRLNVVVLVVPPLRERLDDLPLLAAHFLKKHGGATPPSLSPNALEAMSDYAWPGNVRELENAIVHAIALDHGEVIGVESLPSQIAARSRGNSSGLAFDDEELLPLTEAKRRASTSFEKRYLLRVMEMAKGSVSEAARLAQLDRTNFRRLLQRHGIDSNLFKN